MYKSLLLVAITLCSVTVSGQRVRNVHPIPLAWTGNTGQPSCGTVQERVTAIGDTLTLRHTTASDSFTLYATGADSGYVTGTNAWGDQAFAEQYVFNGYDTSVQVIGLFTLFGGKVSASSQKTVTLNVWNQDLQIPITSTLIYNGFPGIILDTLTVPVTQLGVGPVTDTLKKFMFAAPTSFLSGNFFVGYSISYQFANLNGDTLGIASTKNGERLPLPPYTLVYNTDTTEPSTDTLINVQNATMGFDNVWYDNYTQNDSLFNNLVVYPIVVIGQTTAGSPTISRNNLTFFGNYPNPADGETTIRFGLSGKTTVDILLMDMNGRTIRQYTTAMLSPGNQEYRLATADLPDGDYLYLLRTHAAGMAGKLTVVHSR